MWEDGYISFEIEEDEYNLLCNSFANELCSWVLIEVLKVAGERLKQIGTFPGVHFVLESPSKHPECRAVNIHIDPISEKEVLINCIETRDRDLSLSPEDAVAFILNL